MIRHDAYGYGRFTGGLGPRDGARRLGCSVVRVSGGMTERQVQLSHDFRAMRSEIETGFAIDAVDIYGLLEVTGPGIANECIESKDGLHFWENHFYPEVIKPDSGGDAASGPWRRTTG